MIGGGAIERIASGNGRGLLFRNKRAGLGGGGAAREAIHDSLPGPQPGGPAFQSRLERSAERDAPLQWAAIPERNCATMPTPTSQIPKVCIRRAVRHVTRILRRFVLRVARKLWAGRRNSQLQARFQPGCFDARPRSHSPLDLYEQV